MELGYAHGNMCEWSMRQTKDPLQALPWCEQATAFMRKAVGMPDATRQNRLDLANRLGWQADVLSRAGQFDQIIALRREEAALLDAMLQREPDNFQLRQRRLWPEIGMARAELDANRLGDGLARADRTLVAYAKLAAERPDDRSVTGEQLRIAAIAADAAKRAERPEAAAFLRAARLHYELLRRSYPPKELERFTRMMTRLEQGDRL